MHRLRSRYSPLNYTVTLKLGFGVTQGHRHRIAQIFWVPPIISGTGKTTDFTFGGHINRANPNKSP